MIEILLIMAILFAGSVIQGISGFGFGLFAMALLPFIFTVKESSLLVIALALVTSVTIMLKFRKHIDYKSLIYILSAAVAGRIGAFFILDTFGEEEIMKRILGAVLILMVIYIFMKKETKDPALAEKKWLPLTLGFFGGIVGGVFAVGGPFFVFYFLLLLKDKYAYTATLQATFVITSLLTVTIHLFNGDLGGTFIWYFLAGAVSVIAGSNLGMHYFSHLSSEKIKLGAGILIALAGINLILFN